MKIDFQDPNTNLIDIMTSRSEVPFFAERVNDHFIVAIYQGKISKYDIKIKYREMDENGNWTQVRTPRHVHWVVDILLKMQKNKRLTQKFVDKLLEIWKSTEGITSDEQRNAFLNLDYLLKDFEEYKHFQVLEKQGRYSIKFLLLLIRLLMIQEKTNCPNAKQFKECLETLRNQNSFIFDIISKAAYNGRIRK